MSSEILSQAQRLGFADYLFIFVYFAITLAIGMYYSRGSRGTNAFFLGAGNVPWWAAGLSIFATSVSSITYLSIPAQAYTDNWNLYLSNAGILLIAPFIARYYIPAFRRAPITTAYEFLETRFNFAVRLYGSLCFLAFQTARVSIVLYLPAIALNTTTGLDIYFCILTCGIITTIYTLLGGIEAVIWTDVMQAVVLLIGAVAAFYLVAAQVEGGTLGIVAQAQAENKFNLVRLTWDYTVPAIWVVLIGNAFSMLYPATADQTVVQRYLTTATDRDAARALWTNALITLPVTAIFFALGTALWAFYRTHPEQLPAGLKNDAILPLFMGQEFPAGMKGLVIAGIFAAPMSSLSSSMNSVASVVVTDYYRRFVPAASDRSALRLAQWVTLVSGVFGTGVALYIAQTEVTTMWQSFLAVLNIVGGGLSGVFLLGVFFPRATAGGALTGAIVSACVIFALQFTDIHYMLHGMIGVMAVVAVAFVDSLIPTNEGNS